MTYNLTNLTDSTTTIGIVSVANEFTGGMLVLFFTLAIFFIMLILFRNTKIEADLLVSSFITFLIASIFSYIGLLVIGIPLAFLIIAALSFFYIMLQ